MKVRMSKLSIILLACLMLGISLFGCVGPLETDDEFFDDGYFSFVKVRKDSDAIRHTGESEYFDGDEAIMLLDLTVEGKKQTVIDVPEKVYGLPIISIAPYYWTEGGHIYEIGNNYGNFKSDNLEKIYFNNSLKHVSGVTAMLTKYLNRIIINNQISSIKFGGSIETADNLIVAIHQNCSDEQLYSTRYLFHIGIPHSNIYETNIEYKYNYDTRTAQENYRIDLVKDKTEIPYEFAEPNREGYNFGGWYLEPECINEWDRSIDCLIDEETEDINFYTERDLDEKKKENNAKIEFGEDKYYVQKPEKILRLYAKWIEN